MAHLVAKSTRAGTRLARGGSVTPFRRSRRGRRRAACRPIIRAHEWTFRCLAVGRMPVGPNVGRGIGRDSPPRPSLDLRIGRLVGRSAASIPYERTGRGSDRLTLLVAVRWVRPWAFDLGLCKPFLGFFPLRVLYFSPVSSPRAFDQSFGGWSEAHSRRRRASASVGCSPRAPE